jgi:hypothetical protein
VQGASDSTLLIEHIHAPYAPDPNALLLSFRDEDERKLKLGGLPGKFLKGRQVALERYAKEAGVEDGRLAAFYERKIKVRVGISARVLFAPSFELTVASQENGGLLSIYEGKEDASSFISMSKEAWVNLGKTIQLVEDKLQATYLVGDQISLAE